MLKTTLCASLILGSVAASFAIPINFGFETGDFTGWTTSGGSASVVTSYSAAPGLDFTAPTGSYFALLMAGDVIDVPTTLTQTFALNAGDTLSGHAGFFADDYLPYNDFGTAAIKIGVSETILFSASVSSVGDLGGTTGWVPWSFTATTGGIYTLTYSATNVLDNSMPSKAFFDGASVTLAPAPHSVPDSGSTLALLGAAMSGFAWVRRRMS